jgi:hypothetical protein
VIPVAAAVGWEGPGSDAHLSLPATHALRTNPPLAHSGGFGEPTCRKCHIEYELNDTAGVVLIEGLPARWTAAERYVVTVSLLHPALVVAGFQLSARYEDGERAGRQAGRFMPTDTLVTTAIDTISNVQFAFHTTAGAVLGAQKGRAVWSFDWIAPAEEGGAVVFHVAANAANDDFSDLGDFIFTRSVRVLGRNQRRAELRKAELQKAEVRKAGLQKRDCKSGTAKSAQGRRILSRSR